MCGVVVGPAPEEEPGPGGLGGKADEVSVEVVRGVDVVRVHIVRSGDMVCHERSLKIPGTKSSATVFALSSMCWIVLR